MNNLTLALEGAWKVLVAGLLLGAGLPAIFALGIRSLALGTGGDAELDHRPGNPMGKVLAAVFFGIVLLAVGLGIMTIVASGFGKAVSFEHVYPVLIDKKH